MAKEIERKFIVENQIWREAAYDKRELVQGYLASDLGTSIRVRKVGDNKAFLTIKSSKCALVRTEIEVRIPLREFHRLFKQCHRTIKKIRYSYIYREKAWTIDEFAGGLVLAEVELEDKHQSLEIPNFCGMEVTGNKQFYNEYMAK